MKSVFFLTVQMIFSFNASAAHLASGPAARSITGVQAIAELLQSLGGFQDMNGSDGCTIHSQKVGSNLVVTIGDGTGQRGAILIQANETFFRQANVSGDDSIVSIVDRNGQKVAIENASDAYFKVTLLTQSKPFSCEIDF